tara:strand:- start:13087 stop:14223 length:1137 start_codon:yes stop_codon:yes gene_type:complete
MSEVPTALTTLGQAVEFLDSQRRPVKAADRNPGPYPYFGANGQQGTIDGFIFDEPLVLLAEDGGHFFEPNRGIAYKISGKTWVNNHAHVLRPKSGTDLDYLCLVLKHLDVTPQLTGTTRAKLTKAGASRIQIPLPPLAEQKRIAGILDAADALRAKRRESLAQLDTLLQSTFLTLFGDPVTNPMGWENAPLEKLIDPNRPITYGILKPGPDIEDGIPYVRVVDIKNEQVLVNQLRRTTVEIANQYNRSRLKPGDLLMSIRGHVGRMAITPHDAEGANITQDTARLALAEAEAAYVMQCITTQGMQHYMARRTKGIAVRGINLGDVKKLPIPTPPLDLQHSFAAVVESVERQKARLRAHLAELDTLFASLQSRAFNGEL